MIKARFAEEGGFASAAAYLVRAALSYASAVTAALLVFAQIPWRACASTSRPSASGQFPRGASFCTQSARGSNPGAAALALGLLAAATLRSPEVRSCDPVHARSPGQSSDVGLQRAAGCPRDTSSPTELC